MKILRPLANEMPIVGVFHQPEITQKYCTRIIAIKSGEIVYDGKPNITLEQLHKIYEDEFTEFVDETPSVYSGNNHTVELEQKVMM
jgi:phosphonate transport system ATP-binding protein